MFIGSDKRRMKARGFVLPMTIILLAFATIAIVIAGTVTTRTTQSMGQYRAVSDIQMAADNTLELAVSYVDIRNTSFSSSWAGIEDVIDFVSIRGGLSGHYWAEALEIMSEKNKWYVMDSESGFPQAASALSGMEGYQLEAAIFKDTETRYFVIAWAEKGGILRYSLGMAVRDTKGSKPALTFGDMERVFHQLLNAGHNDKKGKKDTIRGDYIGGDAIIFSHVVVDDDSELDEIFAGDLTTIGISPEKWKDSILSPPGTLEDFFSGLRTDHENALEVLTKTEVSFPLGDDLTYSSPSSNELFEIAFTDSQPDRWVEVSFGETGGKGYVELKYDSKKLRVFETNDGGIANIRVNNANLIITQGNNQTHKTQFIKGKFSLTTDGNINIQSSLCYSSLRSIFHNGNSDVYNQTASVGEVESRNALVRDADVTDYLGLTTIGGAVNFKYNWNAGKPQASHGNKLLTADINALPDADYNGGVFTTSDLGIINPGNSYAHIPQMYVVGSFTGYQFGIDDDDLGDLDQFIIISESDTENGSGLSNYLRLAARKHW